MKRDASPLAGGSMSHVSYYTFSAWMPLVQAALGRTIRNGPELAYLLREGAKVNPHVLEERRDLYRLYISIAAGSNVLSSEGCQGNDYWHARRQVERVAWEVLDQMVFDVPERQSRAIREAKKRLTPQSATSSKFHYMLLQGSLGSFLCALTDRQILDRIFEIFEPAAKTNAAWWRKAEGKSEKERTRAIFFHWLMTNLWSRQGLPDRELTTWARRRTFPWLLKLRRLDYIDGAAIELWAVQTLAGANWKRRHLPLKQRLVKNRKGAKRLYRSPYFARRIDLVQRFRFLGKKLTARR